MRLLSARHSLESAYVINKRSPSSQVWEKPTKTISHSSKRQTVKYDSNIKSERVNIVSTPEPPVTATATRSGMTSNADRIQDYLEAGKIIAAAEKISEGHTQWARFCYDPLHDKACSMFLSRALFCAWCMANKRAIKPGKYDRYRDLVDIALIDTRHRLITGNERFSKSEIAMMLGYRSADHANWYRGIGEDYKLMYEILSQVDSEVLGPVSRTVKLIKGES